MMSHWFGFQEVGRHRGGSYRSTSIIIYLCIFTYIYIKDWAKWTWHVVLKLRQLDSLMSCENRR